MTPLAILTEARRLIEEKGWTQGDFARDRSGMTVRVEDDTACRFCADGAILRASRGDWERYTEAREHLWRAIGAPINHWNDSPGRTKDEVLAAFDKAIELAKAES